MKDIGTYSNPFKCHKCGKEPKNALGYKRHMENHLKIERNEFAGACPRCGKEFLDANYLKKHSDNCKKTKDDVDNHSGPFKCHKCGKEVIRADNYQRHMKRHLKIESNEIAGACQK